MHSDAVHTVDMYTFLWICMLFRCLGSKYTSLYLKSPSVRSARGVQRNEESDTPASLCHSEGPGAVSGLHTHTHTQLCGASSYVTMDNW